MEISLINFYICCCCQTTLHGLEVPGETEEYDLLQQSGVHTSSETCRVLHQVSQEKKSSESLKEAFEMKPSSDSEERTRKKIVGLNLPSDKVLANLTEVCVH